MSFVLPYIELPELVLIPGGLFGPDSPPFSVKPFGVLVAAGVYTGAWVATRYGARRGLSAQALASFIAHVVVSGFVFGHVLEIVFYSPESVVEDPWALVRLWDGLSSFGGFVGAAIGAFVWRWRYATPILPYADVVASGLALGWAFGRAGCAVVHDHPGIASSAWFAVAFPEGPRLDLGLIELTLMIPIAVVFHRLRRRAWPWGFFLAVLCTAYAPVRFLLDFLRISDRRYFVLTPAQWLSVALGAFGVALLVHVLRQGDDDRAFAAPRVSEAFARNDSDADAKRRRRDPDEQR